MSSAKENMLPGLLSNLDVKGNPRNAALFLGSLFTLSLMINALFPEYFEGLLTMVSTILLILYLLGLMAFLGHTKDLKVRALALVFILGIIAVLLSSGLMLLYPLTLISLSYFYSKKVNQGVSVEK